MKKIALVGAIIAALLAFKNKIIPTLISPPENITGTVVAIIDGDTLDVLDENKKQHRIRLEFIDCPEKKQHFGNRAKQALAKMTFRKNVTVRTYGKGKYGRTIGTVLTNNGTTNVNKLLVRSGLCYAYTTASTRIQEHLEYITLEKKAKKEKLGVWSLPEKERTKPWEWRKQKQPPWGVG